MRCTPSILGDPRPPRGGNRAQGRHLPLRVIPEEVLRPGSPKILSRYAEKAGPERPVSPHKMRRFLSTWPKKQGVDDALIQPYSGHESRESLKIYSSLAIGEVRESCDEVMGRFPIRNEIVSVCPR